MLHRRRWLENAARLEPWGAWLALAGVLACGPSFEAIQEGNLRFAHCARLDLDPNIAPSHRLHCWREWRRIYTYGQTRDRVDYAQRRIAEVVSGDTDPPFELPSSTTAARARQRSQRAAPPAGGTSGVAAPSAGRAPADPAQPAPAEPARTAPSSPPTTGDECHARCEAVHTFCTDGCETKPTGCQPCGVAFDACSRACGATDRAAAPP